MASSAFPVALHLRQNWTKMPRVSCCFQLCHSHRLLFKSVNSGLKEEKAGQDGGDHRELLFLPVVYIFKSVAVGDYVLGICITVFIVLQHLLLSVS